MSKDFRERLMGIIAEKHYDKCRPLLIEELERTPHEELYQELLDLMKSLRDEGRDHDEEDVAEVAELMTEWAHPEYRV
ncbi:hypothetical protein [Amycolatopsis thailandensis]|uniref:hypothetical protein n=1 Tax=Amycolatopsis thailandensis TaxID=589330 RepID=UPI00363B83D2